jgi:hypothetical protein
VNDILKTVQGKFILSINHNPQTREIFKGFKTARVKTQYRAGHAGNKPVTELLISNF